MLDLTKKVSPWPCLVAYEVALFSPVVGAWGDTIVAFGLGPSVLWVGRCLTRHIVVAFRRK